MGRCDARPRSCIWISTPSSPRSSSGTSRRYAASPSSWVGSEPAAWWRPRRTRPESSASARRCRRRRRAAGARTPRSWPAASGRTGSPVRRSCRSCENCPRWSSRCPWTRRSSICWRPGEPVEFSPDGLRTLIVSLKADVAAATGGLTASVGAGTSKFVAKVASELGKPDGSVLVEPGSEVELLGPMSVGVIPGVGPVTRERLPSDRHPHGRGPAGLLARRARAADRPGARLGAGRAGVRAGRPGGRAGAGDQVDLGGGHLRAGRRRPG